jgi:TonB family protein
MNRGPSPELLVAAILLAAGHTVSGRDSSEKYVLVSEWALRRNALHAPIPVYPESSKRNRVTGVAVVKVKLDRKGSVAETSVLQSPDTPIGESVSATVSTWRFRQEATDSVDAPIVGRLVFYFLHENGNWIVRGPRIRRKMSRIVQ